MKDQAAIEKYLRVKVGSITKEPQYVTYDYLPDIQGCFFKDKKNLIIQAIEVESNIIFAQIKGKKWVYIGEDSEDGTESEEDWMDLLEGIQEDCQKVGQEVVYIITDNDDNELELVQ